MAEDNVLEITHGEEESDLVVTPYTRSRKELSSHEAMNVLELSKNSEDTEAASTELMLNAEHGTDVQPALTSQRRAETSAVTGMLRQDIDATLGDPSVTTEQRVEMLKYADQVDSTEWSGFFENPEAAEDDAKIRKINEYIDAGAGYYTVDNVSGAAPLALPIAQALSNLWKVEKAVDLDNVDPNAIYGVDMVDAQNLLGEDKDNFWRGALDSVLTEVTFSGMLIKAVFDDKDWKENVAELEVWEAYRKHEADQDVMYASGMVGGTAIGWIGDVFTGALLKSPKAAAEVLKMSRTTTKLATELGTAEAGRLVKSSHSSIVAKLKSDEVLLQTVLDTVEGGNDIVARKMIGAAKEAATSPTTTTISAGTLRPVVSPMASTAATAATVGDATAQEALRSGVALANNSTAQGLANTQELLVKAIDAEDALVLTMIPELKMSGVVNPTSELGVSLNNSGLISNVVADQLFYDVAQSAQRLVQTVDTVRIAPAMEAAAGRTAYFSKNVKPFEGVRKYAGVLVPGNYKFKGASYEGLVNGVMHSKQTNNVLKKSFSKQLDTVYRGLSKEEDNLLESMIAAADDAESYGRVLDDGVLEIGGTTFPNATPKLIDKFRARQMVMRNAHSYVNANAVAQAQEKGWKQFGEHIAAPIKHTDIPSGSVVIDAAGRNVSDYISQTDQLKFYELSSPTESEFVQYLAVSSDHVMAELDDTAKLIGEQAGYMRHEITDKYTVVRTIPDKNGTVIGAEPVATGETWKDVSDFIGRQAAKKDKSSYVGVRSSGGMSDLTYSNSWMQTAKKMTDEQFDEMLSAMAKAGDFDAQAIADITALRDKYGYKNASQLMQRSEKGLKSVKGGAAPLHNAKEADALYLNWVSKYTTEGDYVTRLESKFMEEYGSKLGITKPYQEITATTALGEEAIAFQKQLKSISGRTRNHMLERVDAMAQRNADKFIRADLPGVSRVAEYLDDALPYPSGVLRGASKATTVAALGGWNIIQLPLQFSSGFLNVTGATVGKLAAETNRAGTFKAAATAQWDMINWLWPNALKKHGKYSADVWNFVERSGIAAGFDYEDFARQILNTKHLSGMTDMMYKGVSKAADNSLMFSKQGEKLGQVYALLASRRLLEADAKAGKHAVLTAADVANGGSQKLLDLSVERAKSLALNMAKYNAAGITQGELSSLIFKFKDFGIHQAALFAPGGQKGLSSAELWGLRATWVGMFGPKGVPFAWDALIGAEMMAGADEPEGKIGEFTVGLVDGLAEKAGTKLSEWGAGEHTKDIRLWLEDGVLGAHTEGDLRLGTRFANGEFFSDYMTSANMDEAMLGAAYSKAKEFLFGDVPDTLTGLLDLTKKEDVALADVGSATSPLLNQLSGLQNFVQAYDLFIEDSGVIKDKKGRVLIDGPTLGEKIQRSIGLTPGDVVEQYDYQSLLYRQKSAVYDYTWEKSKEIAGIEDPEIQSMKLDMLMAELNGLGMSSLIPAITSKVYGESQFIDKTFSLEQRNMFLLYNNVKSTGMFNSLYKRMVEGE